VASNQWGVDVSYFSRELDALKRSLPNRTPGELHRYLLRLAAIVEPAQAQATADNKRSRAIVRGDMPEDSWNAGDFDAANFHEACGDRD